MTSWYELTPQEWTAFLLSMRVAFWSVLFLTPLGIYCGWLLSRKDFFGKSILDALIHLPLVVPPIVVGYLLLIFLGKRHYLGYFLSHYLGIDLAFSWYAAVIASGIMGFPLLVRAVRLSVDLVDLELEKAASTLGASPFYIFWTITFPLSLPGILTGMLLSFARSIGEFGATITFAGNIEGETRTLPLAIFSQTQIPGREFAATRLVILSIILSLFALFASDILARQIKKKLGFN